MITKRAENSSNHARRVIPFQAARKAFRAILNALEVSNGKVLLPSYIGWSPREGSGVFDPIASLHLDYSFYALDERLRIDIGSLRTELESGSVRVLVIIHYFGYVDPCYEEAVKIAREHGVFVLEDEAHAMLSDLVGGICGRLGDACIYSFHKILPVESGGAAVINDAESPLAQALVADPESALPLYDYDLNRIADKRRANSLVLDRLVRELAPEIEPLLGAPGCPAFPQSYPVMIRNGSRDRVYHDMNAAGFGVVSLYHTLISQISPGCFPAAAKVSRHILNLPVHQDASEGALESMVRELASCVRRA
ncbi:MAG: DegT/DnrJ/EryC1/StrS family aminotransferase [Bryobacteraceae bacterium]|jgi:dTDP-4-amino-4,6-dideoxygalactose transaminase